MAPGGTTSTLISVLKSANMFLWKSTNMLSDNSAVFKSTVAKGKPIMGCYIGGTYTAASFIPSRVTSTLRLYAGVSDTVMKLPAGVILARCGAPVHGSSAVYSVVKSAGRGTLNVVGKVGSQQVLRSRPLNKRLSPKKMELITVPRASGVHPTVMVLARLGRARVLQLLDRGGRWQTVVVPGMAKGDKVSAAVGVRLGNLTYLVVQLMGRSGKTSYRTLVVPAQLL